MSGIEFKKYTKREGVLYVRHPQVYMDPEKGITVKIVESKGDPYDYRKFEELKSGKPPSCETPQRLAQNE